MEARNLTTRMDLPGVGFMFKTIVDTNPSPPGPPPAVSGLQVTGVGGSWADLAWTSPAAAQFDDEVANDSAVMAYAIRYSQTPIMDEAAWEQAVPVETVVPVFGPGIAQQYATKGLKFNTQYYAAVRTYNEDGVGSAIASVAITTKAFDIDTGSGASGENPPASGDLTPPAAPTNFRLVPIGG
jgi:hypothetical protein